MFLGGWQAQVLTEGYNPALASPPRVGAEVRINYFHRLTYRADSVVVGKSSRTERRVGPESSGSKIKPVRISKTVDPAGRYK